MDGPTANASNRKKNLHLSLLTANVLSIKYPPILNNVANNAKYHQYIILIFKLHLLSHFYNKKRRKNKKRYKPSKTHDKLFFYFPTFQMFLLQRFNINSSKYDNGCKSFTCRHAHYSADLQDEAHAVWAGAEFHTAT